MRLYSFVAGHYMSDLQKGLQTAHGVARLFKESTTAQNPFHYDVLREWADKHDTIIILNAANHQGVTDVYLRLKDLAARLGLPITIFHEDEQSMNGMATCTTVVVPEEYYAVKSELVEWDMMSAIATLKLPTEAQKVYVYREVDLDGNVVKEQVYKPSSPEYEFISILKSYNLA